MLNIINMFPKTGSKYNLSAVSKSVETVWITVDHDGFVTTLFAAVRVHKNNQIRFLVQFYLAWAKTIIFFLSVTILSLST
jgi:hypothetical protein